MWFRQKTAKYWFGKLPKNYERENAIANTQAHRLKLRYDSLSTALMLSFRWKDTPEGFGYWRRVYKKAGGRCD